MKDFEEKWDIDLNPKSTKKASKRSTKDIKELKGG